MRLGRDVGARRHFVVSNDGLRLAVLEWGTPEGEPVVLLHGAAQLAAVWRRLAATMPHRRVVALDQRGFGDSDRAAVYGTRPMTADVTALADQLGIARFDLVGLSMGGVVAIAFAAHHPERVRNLAVLDVQPMRIQAGMSARAFADPDAEVWPRFASAEEAVSQWAASVPSTRPDLQREDLLLNLTPAPGGGLTLKWDKALRDGTATWDDDPRGELWRMWEQLPMPTMLVRAGNSDVLTADVATEMIQRLPGSTLTTIEGAHHNLVVDAPEELAAIIGSFIDAGTP